MKLFPMGLGGVVERQEHHVPPMCRAVRLRTNQDARMERILIGPETPRPFVLAGIQVRLNFNMFG
jgi:hypothetical protein